jgi:hypothetical protein
MWIFFINDVQSNGRDVAVRFIGQYVIKQDDSSRSEIEDAGSHEWVLAGAIF